MIVIDSMGRQLNSINKIIEEYLATLDQKEHRKAMKDDKNKVKPNPLEDPDKLRQFFIYFVKEIIKGQSKWKFHLPESSKEWIEYKSE